jgi:NitT/TauT family transport system ATP-binding protein
MTFFVRLANIAKQFESGTLALDDLSLDLKVGHFTSLVGPSGCGKSTVLRLIAGLTLPSSGNIERRADKASISFVFQEPTLLPWASVLDNVRLPLRIARLDKQQALELAREALHKVGLSEFGASYPRQLSGGMAMRVSIARALVTRPKILLMDEPFAALDEMTRSRLNLELLSIVKEQQLSVVFVTHSIYESAYLSDRVLVMTDRPGKIIHDLAIHVDGPRDEQYRTSAQYGAYCREISSALGRHRHSLAGS